MVDAAHKKMADDLAQAKEAKEQERADAAAKAEYQASGERMIGEYAEDMPAYVDAVLDEAYETDKKPTTSAKERLRLAEAAVKYLEERHRELTAKYKGQPNSVKTLKNIKGDLDRVRALRRSLYQQVNQKPKGSLRQDMAAAAASAVVPVSETNETGGTKSEGTNGGAVTLSPPGTANMVAALSPEDDALLEDDENDTGSPSTNEPTTPPPAVQGIQGEDQGGAPAAPTDTGAAGGVPVEEPEEGGSRRHN